eukprot:TRINITY_DN3937_c0_g1_i2.p1 TRINITY_DN3937_c0_g1~~TRINITY_DN3937_c0_g1_i2.p1  ORF type:complete len:176 (-),score=37.66 TRINITY_DN3937_c0_g1_i2:500-985(-)
MGCAASKQVPQQRDALLSAPMPYDYDFRVIFLGSSSVGKTCILNRMLHVPFVAQYEPTIGVDEKNATLHDTMDGGADEAEAPQATASTTAPAVSTRTVATVGSCVHEHMGTMNNKSIRLVFFDTGGQERFRYVAHSDKLAVAKWCPLDVFFTQPCSHVSGH